MMITLLTPTTSNANPTFHLTNTVKNYQKPSSQSQIKSDSFQIKHNPREETPAIVASPTVTNPPVALVDSPSLPATTTSIPAGFQPATFQTATNSALAPVNAVKLATNTKPTDLGLIGTILAGVSALGVIGLGVALWTKHGEFNRLNGDLTTLKQTVAQQRKLITELESIKQNGITGLESLNQALETLKQEVKNKSLADDWGKTYPERIDKLPESPKIIEEWAKDWFHKGGLNTLNDIKDRIFDVDNTFFKKDKENKDLRQDAKFLAEEVLPAFMRTINHLSEPKKANPIKELQEAIEILQPTFEEIIPNVAHTSPTWNQVIDIKNLPQNITKAEKLALKIRATRLSSNNPDDLKPLVEKVYLLLRDQLGKIPA